MRRHVTSKHHRQRFRTKLGWKEEILTSNTEMGGFRLWQLGFLIAVVFGTGAYLILGGLLSSPAASPDNDYWETIIAIFPEGKFSLDLNRWLRRNNEHITFIPRLIYVANIALANGDNLYLQLTSFAFSLLSAFLLVVLLPNTIRRSRLWFVVTVPFIALLIFTPHAAHSWFLGFSGIIWFSANLFFLGTVLAIRRARDRTSVAWFGFGTACAVASYLSYSTGAMTMVLGLVFLVWWRAPRTWIAIFALVCAVVIASTSGTIARPPYHPEWVFDFLILTQFVGRYLGNFVSDISAVEIGTGLTGLFLYAMALFTIIRRDPLGLGDYVPWILVATYPLGAAFITAFSRAGFGIEAATASRYASLASLFWIGVLIVLLGLAIDDRKRISRYTWLFLVTIAGTSILVGSLHTERVEYHIDRNHLKRLAEIGLYMGIQDPALLQPITPATKQFTSQIDKLKRMHHAPFANRPECAKWLGRHIVPTGNGEVKGHVDVARHETSSLPEYTEIQGWTSQDGQLPRCIAIIDPTGAVVGAGVSGFRRLDVKKALGFEEVRTGWRALMARSGNGPWVAAALYPEDAGWIRFGECFRFLAGELVKSSVSSCN